MTSQAPTQGPTDAGLTARVLSSEWQPIETAPKDGSRYLIYVPRVATDSDSSWFTVLVASYVGGYDSGDVWFTMLRGKEKTYGEDIYDPTHWMPLPTPPTNPKGAA